MEYFNQMEHKQAGMAQVILAALSAKVKFNVEILIMHYPSQLLIHLTNGDILCVQVMDMVPVQVIYPKEQGCNLIPPSIVMGFLELRQVKSSCAKNCKHMVDMCVI